MVTLAIETAAKAAAAHTRKQTSARRACLRAAFQAGLTRVVPEATGFFDEYSRQVTSSRQPQVHEFFWGLGGGPEDATE